MRVEEFGVKSPAQRHRGHSVAKPQQKDIHRLRRLNRLRNFAKTCPHETRPRKNGEWGNQGFINL